MNQKTSIFSQSPVELEQMCDKLLEEIDDILYERVGADLTNDVAANVIAFFAGNPPP